MTTKKKNAQTVAKKFLAQLNGKIAREPLAARREFLTRLAGSVRKYKREFLPD
jgi:hypothetical protein